MSRGSVVGRALVRAHRILPGVAGYLHTQSFVHTRELGSFPDDVCPLGARRVELIGVPRVGAAYVWGSSDGPTVLAVHGWGADTTSMMPVVDAALGVGAGAMCFDAPGHGASPGSHATITEYADATREVLQRFPSIQTVVAHSLGSIAAVSAVAQVGGADVRHILLLAPACSLSGVLERWAAQRGLPPSLVERIYRELKRRDGVPVSHWDIRTLGLPTYVRVQILHDPDDDSVPLRDAHLIAAAVTADMCEVPGTGHFGIVGSDAMRAALTSCLQRDEIIE